MVYKNLFFILLLLISNWSVASIYEYFPQKLEPSSSNYGITGIIQMPNARIMAEGSMKIGYSTSFPYEYTYISATPFSWLEASYKYTEFKNALYVLQIIAAIKLSKIKGLI